LEGTDPYIVLAPPEQGEERAGAAKGARDLQAPPWSKGRYGSMIGRAVHGVLQTVDLLSPERLDAVIAAQAIAEGVSDHIAAIEGFVRSALACSLVREAAASEHWREAFVALTDDEGVLHGYIDLIFRRPSGTLVVLDYKTDTVPDAAIPARVAHYAPQLRAYGSMLEAATGATIELFLCFLDHSGAEARVERVVN
jgi:ATP-dependent exoDNAse (exonuclease V) beta subunit